MIAEVGRQRQVVGRSDADLHRELLPREPGVERHGEGRRRIATAGVDCKADRHAAAELDCERATQAELGFGEARHPEQHDPRDVGDGVAASKAHRAAQHRIGRQELWLETARCAAGSVGHRRRSGIEHPWLDPAPRVLGGEHKAATMGRKCRQDSLEARIRSDRSFPRGGNIAKTGAALEAPSNKAAGAPSLGASAPICNR